MAVDERDTRPSGLDALEVPIAPQVVAGAGASGTAAWPKLLAIAIVLGVWQFLDLDRVEAGVRASRRPRTRSRTLFDNWSLIMEATWTTLRRGFQGYAIAIVIGVDASARPSHGSRSCAPAIGSMITGLQTMPSVAWYPLAIISSS